MHCHLEVVMPQRDDTEEALDEILAPFREGRRSHLVIREPVPEPVAQVHKSPDYHS